VQSGVFEQLDKQFPRAARRIVAEKAPFRDHGSQVVGYKKFGLMIFMLLERREERNVFDRDDLRIAVQHEWRAARPPRPDGRILRTFMSRTWRRN